ncbi:deoxyuridine 5'-triphosphate nucleotidohydrolase [candidate division LCP-89 bacterium B3_LCP]|uniref:Deoxyuridine 5'-triphosphate nucleotidohydrolase n=1 Tax=candidate division LCP-89 bacterium B3_LCP TaxID=2012998 RepID=A0A532V3G4_UNCL8|nr:MAG: deoxyuridine 5'-triphosphate nucleotidohydrolase [candidate division LCP-89 bacterium B3_LCP]
MEEIPVKITRLRGKRWPLPAPATPLSAGLDLYADIGDPMSLEPGQTNAIPTGIAIALPNGWEAQVRPRSGLALEHSIGMLNAPGTIDADYRGEIKVLLTNFGKEPFTLKPGARIAQLVLSQAYHPRWIELDDLPLSDRGDGGFGHTGS